MAKVLVLDGHSAAALAFTRSLGKAKHWVAVGFSRGMFAPAALSRYCRTRLEYPPSTESRQAFTNAVLEFVSRNNIELIFPVTDWTTIPLSQVRDQFEASCHLVLPSPGALEIASDKYRTIEVARSQSVPVPRTWLLQSPPELQAVPELKFPIVVKDRYSVRWLGDRAEMGSVVYAYSRPELERRVRERLEKVGDVLVQEFVTGAGLGFSCFACGSDVRLPFQWLRLREVDPRGSGSSLRKSVPLSPDILDFSSRLIASAVFEGIAMVEYKKPDLGPPILMEINGRPWGSIQLAIAAGIDYPRYLADWALYGSLPNKESTYRKGIVCRRMIGELTHLSNLRRGKPPEWPAPYPNFWITVAKMALPWYPGLRYDDLSFSDPKPGWAGIQEWLRSRLLAKRG